MVEAMYPAPTCQVIQTLYIGSQHPGLGMGIHLIGESELNLSHLKEDIKNMADRSLYKCSLLGDSLICNPFQYRCKR